MVIPPLLDIGQGDIRSKSQLSIRGKKVKGEAKVVSPDAEVVKNELSEKYPTLKYPDSTGLVQPSTLSL